MHKKFFQYVVPAMLAFAFSGLYTIVDGFFIGRNVGDTGLAAISIAFPLTALIQAAGTGLGMGGAIQISICRGKGEEAQGKKYFGNALVNLLAAGVLSTLLLLLFYRPALSALGAQGMVLDEAENYLRIIALGALFQLCATGFTPILRNYGQSLLAMSAMVAGFLVNIALDWLFVSAFQYGMAGAAWATVIGQIVTVAACLPFLIKKAAALHLQDYKWKASTQWNILKTGISPFGLTMSPFIVMMLLNRWAVLNGGENSVAAYSVVSYITSIVILLLQGISDGSQPLISLRLGEGDPEGAKKVRKLAYGFAGLAAMAAGTAVLLFGGRIPEIFGASGEVVAIAARSLPVFAAGFLFVAFCRVTTSYFYAVHKNLSAYVMVYGEPILLAALLCLLPRLFGLDGVWLSALTAQITLSAVGLALVLLENSNCGKLRKPRGLSQIEA